MEGIFTRINSDSDGAITVDWIVLTGLVVGLTISVMALLNSGAGRGSTGMVDPASITTEF